MKQKVGEYAERLAAAFAKGTHVVVAPGDRIPVKGLEHGRRNAGHAIARAAHRTLLRGIAKRATAIPRHGVCRVS